MTIWYAALFSSDGLDGLGQLIATTSADPDESVDSVNRSL